MVWKRRTRHRECFYWSILGIVVALGCDSPGTAPTVPARGMLFHNGKPAQAARIIFTPKSGRPATGNTDDEGRFVLSTFESDDGAVPGEHVVTVSDLERNWNQDPSKSRFPTAYERPDTTPLVVKVKPDNENSFSFDMENQLESSEGAEIFDARKPAFSHIGEDGGFTMMTRQPGDGVETGQYAVTFTVLNNQQAAKSLIPSRYNVPRTTSFQVTVDSDKNDWLFELDKQ